VSATTAHPAGHRYVARVGRFALHFGEMCIPMCIGFGVGDLVYFGVADLLGYSEPFRELPALSVVIVTFNMTAPMVAWMRFRGMPQRQTAEMAASMVVLAVVLLGVGWLGLAPMSALPWLAHGLMMPAMLVPMLLRLDFYSGHAMRSGA
jgi:hypothetical protein